MNNIVDVIPSLVFVSAAFGLVVGLGVTTFELFASRRSALTGYEPQRQAALPRRAALVLHQSQAQAPANAEPIQAAA